MLRKSYIRTAHKNYISQVLEAKHGKLFSQSALHVTRFANENGSRFANENGGMHGKHISPIAPATSL